MKVEGTYQIPAAPERVWQILMDPVFIRKCIPGCEEMVEESAGVYRVTIKAGVGAIKSSFNGQVRVEQQRPPEHYRMVTSAKGSAGFVNGTGDVDLAGRDGATEVRYQGEVQVGGMLAAVGSRMVEAAFRKAVNEFFAGVAAQARTE